MAHNFMPEDVQVSMKNTFLDFKDDEATPAEDSRSRFFSDLTDVKGAPFSHSNVGRVASVAEEQEGQGDGRRGRGRRSRGSNRSSGKGTLPGMEGYDFSLLGIPPMGALPHMGGMGGGYGMPGMGPYGGMPPGYMGWPTHFGGGYPTHGWGDMGMPTHVPTAPPPTKMEKVSRPAKAKAKAAPVASDGPESTLMVRHIPQSYTQTMLLAEIESKGFPRGGAIDFFYLPIDFRKEVSVGYCFLNLTSPALATRFREVFDQTVPASPGDHKPLEVCSARLQGLQANVEHFRNSAVMLESIAVEHKPALFDARGNLLKFPEPNGQVRKKTLRKARALAVGA
mmetsp:Transcript_6831/g.15423  ORF Transcript_6831/g.15423 Transcript_6831/m.15423 type:complete len:338 (+) Transcript_6831:110-1123(+)